MRKLTTILLLALAALSCQAEKQNPWDEDWDKPDVLLLYVVACH